MADYDWGHLDKAAADALTYEPGKSVSAGGIRRAILSALTPADLAHLMEEKCPGWVAVPRDVYTPGMRDACHVGGQLMEHLGESCACEDVYHVMLDAAPKMGE